MKKYLFIILGLSLFFININYGKCDDVTVKNNNNNENIGAVSSVGNGGAHATTIGNFLQALKFSAYSSDGVLKKSKYLKIWPGTQSGIDVYCSTDQYNFSSINKKAADYCKNKQAFDYLALDGVSMFSGKATSYGYWTAYTAKAKTIDEVIWDEDNNHKNLWDILNAMDIKPSNGDYLIVEPVVTVKCNNKIYSGTINSLMQANVSFLRSSHISGNACGLTSDDNFVFYYSAIGQSFKTTDAGSCNTVSSSWNKKIGNVTIYPTTTTSNYDGCGYNKYDLSKFSNPSCSITQNPIERINSYKKYVPENGVSTNVYRNILNFTIDANSDKACGEADPYTTNKSCLYLGSNDTFNEKNLSGYTYITEIEGKTAFCNNSIKLNSKIGDSWTSKAGMAFIGGTISPTTVATANITLTCYLYGNSFTYADINSDPFNEYKYNDLISNLKLDGVDLTPRINNSTKTIQSEGTYLNANYIKYEKVISVSYETPKTYIDRVTGYQVGSENSNKIERYGIYSLFTETVEREVPYSIILGSKSNLRLNEGIGKCKYTPEGGIVKDKPKLEFRTIDTLNPFIGEDGSGRTVGANWCSENPDGTWDCSSTNDLIQKTIIKANNSYNVKGVKPKYKFVLTPSVITKIRNYNKEIPLDKHEKCVNNICTNPFFNEIKESIKIGRDKLVK